MNKEDKALRNTITFLALLFMFSAIVASGSLESVDFERVLEALLVVG